MSKQNIICEFSERINWSYNFIAEKRKVLISGMWNYLPEIPDPVNVSMSNGNDVWLTYPYNKQLKTDIIKAFLDAGWTKYYEITEAECGNSRNPRVTFVHPTTYKLEVIVEFDATKPGSTCVRKVIGKEQKEVDIVEFVCAEENI